MSAAQSESSEGPNGLLDWGAAFLGLVDNAAVLPKMVDLLSLERFGHVHPDCSANRAHEIRLDHDYLNVMRGSPNGTYSESGTSQLHSAGLSALHATAVYELADVPENMGGLCARSTLHTHTRTHWHTYRHTRTHWHIHKYMVARSPCTPYYTCQRRGPGFAPPRVSAASWSRGVLARPAL